MSHKWQWFVGIATLGGLAITALLIATVPGLHGLSFALGIAVGATAAALIAVLKLPSANTPPKVKPKVSAAATPNATIASPRNLGSMTHGPRLTSYRRIPGGRGFQWTNSGGKAGMIVPEGEGFVLYDGQDVFMSEVATVDEAVAMILAANPERGIS